MSGKNLVGLSEKIPTQIEGKDAQYIAIRTGLSMIPGLGPAAIELFNVVFSPSLEQRRNEWLNNLALMIEKLRDEIKDFSIDSLKQNDQFISAVMHANQIALRNHQIEKKQALLNAIRNIALGKTLEEDIQLMFLNYIDTLTPSHLKILAYLRDPRKWGELHGIQYPDWVSGGKATVLEYTFPELRNKREIYVKLYNDLYNYGLVPEDNLHSASSPIGMFLPLTTNFGKQFLDFISQ